MSLCNTVGRKLLPLITVSEMRCFLTCQEKHNLRYVALREPIFEQKSAAYFGNLSHYAMEHFYRGLMEGDSDASDRGMSEMRKMWASANNPDPFVWASVSMLMSGYFIRYADEPIEVLSVEGKFRHPMINPDTGSKSRTFDLGGMMDVVVRWLPTGEILLVEHKSTSLDFTPGSDYWTKLRLDSQVSEYFDGAKSLGFEIDGCLYDVLKRPGQLPSKATPMEIRKYTQPNPCPSCKESAKKLAKEDGYKLLVKDIPLTPDCGPCAASVHLYSSMREFDETPAEYGERIGNAIASDPDTYYQRGMVRRLNGELEKARWNSWTIAGQIREATRTGRHVPNYSACYGFNSLCGYFQACTGDVDIWDDSRFQDRPAKHSELA